MAAFCRYTLWPSLGVTSVSSDMLIGLTAAAVHWSIASVDQYFTVAVTAPAVSSRSVLPLERSFGTGWMTVAVGEGVSGASPCSSHGAGPHPARRTDAATTAAAITARHRRVGTDSPPDDIPITPCAAARSPRRGRRPCAARGSRGVWWA